MKKRLYMALCICLSVILICGANNAAAKRKVKQRLFSSIKSVGKQ